MTHPDMPNEVTVSDTQVYVSDSGGGMAILDVSNPITPTLIFTYDTVGYTSYMALVGNYLYVADRFGGLLIFERDTDDTSTRKVERPSVYKLGNVVSGAAYQRAEIIGLPFPATTTEVTSHTLPFVAPTFPLTITHIVTSSLDSGPGTLRQALLDAGQGDTILFNPIVFPPSDPVTINLNIPLPVITQGHLTIDASNAGVILDGKSLPEPSNGFTIELDYNLIRGLQILYIPGWGIGIEIHGAHNEIGGDRSLGTGPVGQGNLIGGNYYGIRISGISATDNAIIGNMIGTTPDGNAAIANKVGIEIREGASRNRVGGITPGERNIISGNSIWWDPNSRRSHE